MKKEIFISDGEEEGLDKFNKKEVRELDSDVRFCRLTWNENKWLFPSGHPWSKANQIKEGVDFENQYGFGHEEWLFNTLFSKDEFNYANIRGLGLVRSTVNKINRVYLYSVNKYSHIRNVYYVGYIDNVIILPESERITLKDSLFKKYLNQMIDDLKNVKADSNYLVKRGFRPNVKFKLVDVHLNSVPVIVDFPLDRYKRFQPYKITDKVEELFLPKEVIFIPGKSSQSDSYERSSVGSSSTIFKKHSQIINGLEKYLKPVYTAGRKNISIERSRFSGKIADVVLKHNSNSISIIEVKTDSDSRKNIRDAIGQLLDYSLHSGKYKIKRLIICGPTPLEKMNFLFVTRLQKVISMKIEYWYYQNDNIVEQIK